MKQVLIVEDNPIWAKIFADYSRQMELVPIVVNSPQAAMDVMDGLEPAVMILDMLLATETGMALLGEMRGYEDLAKVPIIVCSSVSGIDQGQLKSFGVRYVFDKSTVEPMDIRIAIRNLINE